MGSKAKLEAVGTGVTESPKKKKTRMEVVMPPRAGTSTQVESEGGEEFEESIAVAIMGVANGLTTLVRMLREMNEIVREMNEIVREMNEIMREMNEIMREMNEIMREMNEIMREMNEIALEAVEHLRTVTDYFEQWLESDNNFGSKLDWILGDEKVVHDMEVIPDASP